MQHCKQNSFQSYDMTLKTYKLSPAFPENITRQSTVTSQPAHYVSEDNKNMHTG
jgi:hypothetical protein